MKKRILTISLVAVLLCAVLPAEAAGFSDITDVQTAQNVEVLQMMNVINGISPYTFAPDGILTRAQFCKMAVMILGKEGEVAAYQSFTIFPDVKSSHWAAGYVNLAVRGETKFISGFADGSFGPDQTITFGQAVTILMRLLGYTDQDVGMVWPAGYINAAAAAGLTEGVSAGANSGITRAEAAQLFVNLLGSKTKQGESNFSALVAASVREGAVLLDGNAKTEDGSAAIETTEGRWKLAYSHSPTRLQGRMGDVLLNAKGEAWGFLPSKIGTTKDITIASARAGKLIDSEGKEYALQADTPVYYDGETTNYGESFIHIRSGSTVTLHLGVTGKVERLFVGSSKVERAVVLGKDGERALPVITGDRTDYAIIRQGEEVKPSQLKAYDVATYHPAEGKVYISTLRLSGYYQSAYPNAEAPSKIKMLGQEFSVLPSAIPTLSKFKVGESVTLLLTRDFQVAGAVAPKTLSGNAIGIASVSGQGATVELLEGLTLGGTIVSSNAASYDGLLVSVSSYQADQISITPVKQNSRPISLDVTARMYGSYPLAAGVKLFERTGNSAMREILLGDIRMDQVMSANIPYSRINDQGKADLLILDTVSGSCFTYGLAKRIKTELLHEEFSVPLVDANGDPVFDADGNPMYQVLSPGGTSTQYSITLQSGEEQLGPFYEDTIQTGQWVGIALNNTGNKIVDSVKLKVLRNVSNEHFLSESLLRVDGVTYELSDEIVCYNRTTGLWCTLNSARAFGGEMTLYFDAFQVVRCLQVG